MGSAKGLITLVWRVPYYSTPSKHSLADGLKKDMSFTSLTVLYTLELGYLPESNAFRSLSLIWLGLRTAAEDAMRVSDSSKEGENKEGENLFMRCAT